jgi:sulfonate transport system substrate-binding protein
MKLNVRRGATSAAPASATDTPLRRDRRRTLRHAAAVCGLLAGVAVFVPLAQGAQSKGPNLSGVTLTVATYPGIGDDTLLKAAGLSNTPYTLKFAYFPSAQLQSTEVNSGVADIARGSGVSNVFLQASGTVNYTSVATYRLNTLQQDTLVGPGSTITSLAQLKGKKVAFPPDTTSEYVLLKQLQSVGLTLNDIDAVPLNPAPALAALLSGSVDAICTFGNVWTAEAHGAKVLASGSQILAGSTGQLAATYNVYSPDLSDPAKKAAIVDYLARMNTAFAWARANASAWAQIEATGTGQAFSYEFATFKAGERTAPEDVVPVEPKVVAQQQDIANVFAAAGVIPAAIKVSNSYSNVLGPALAAADAAYKKKYKSDFVTPSWFNL